MSGPVTLDADDLAATLTAFAIGLVAALRPTDPDQVLQDLTNELRGLVGPMGETGAADAVNSTIAMLDASRPETA